MRRIDKVEALIEDRVQLRLLFNDKDEMTMGSLCLEHKRNTLSTAGFSVYERSSSSNKYFELTFKRKKSSQ